VAKGKLQKVVVQPRMHDARGEQIPVTPERIKGWVDRFKAIRAKRYLVPMPWGHQRDAVPVHEDDLANSAFHNSRYNAGFVDDVEQDPSGNLVMTVDPPPGYDLDPETGHLVNAVDKTQIRDVSLQADRWVDRDKRPWDDALVHVALVTYPVDHEAGGFKPHEGARGTDGATATGQQLAMSLVRMAYTSDGDSPVSPAKPVIDPNYRTAGGADDDLPELLSLLSQCGIPLPDDTTGENFKDRLRTGLKVAVGREAMNQQAQADKAKAEQPPQVPEGATPERSTAVRMSLADARTPTEQIMFARAERQCRRNREALIDQLAAARDGQGVPLYTDAEIKAWRDEAAAVQFSLLTATGDPEETPLDRELAVARRMADRFAPAKLSLASPLPHPLDRAGDAEKRNKEAGNWMLGLLGREPAAT
jgi:hypothetical protein